MDDDVVQIDLFSETQFDGVTSGADVTAWDPIMVDKEEKADDDDEVLDEQLELDKQPSSVTSGNDSVPRDD